MRELNPINDSLSSVGRQDSPVNGLHRCAASLKRAAASADDGTVVSSACTNRCSHVQYLKPLVVKALDAG